MEEDENIRGSFSDAAFMTTGLLMIIAGSLPLPMSGWRGRCRDRGGREGALLAMRFSSGRSDWQPRWNTLGPIFTFQGPQNPNWWWNAASNVNHIHEDLLCKDSNRPRPTLALPYWSKCCPTKWRILHDEVRAAIMWETFNIFINKLQQQNRVLQNQKCKNCNQRPEYQRAGYPR